MSGISARDMQRIVASELSVRARLSHTALLLVSAAMTTVVCSLWLTEPALPLRTQAGFALIAAIGVSWTAFAAWVLTTRRVLLAWHQVIAARMAVVFCGIFVAGCLTLASWGGMGRGAYAAGIVGMAMMVVAIALLISARRRVARLTARKRQIEAAIASPPNTGTAGNTDKE